MLNGWIFPTGQSGEACLWRVCYQQSLPRIVIMYTAYVIMYTVYVMLPRVFPVHCIRFQGDRLCSSWSPVYWSCCQHYQTQVSKTFRSALSLNLGNFLNPYFSTQLVRLSNVLCRPKNSYISSGYFRVKHLIYLKKKL